MVSLTRRAKLTMGASALLLGYLEYNTRATHLPLQHIVRTSVKLSPQMKGWLRKDKDWTCYCIDIYERGQGDSYEAKARLCKDLDQLSGYPYASPRWRSSIQSGEQLLNEMRRASDDVPVAWAISTGMHGGCRLRYTEVYAPFKAQGEICPVVQQIIKEYQREKAGK